MFLPAWFTKMGIGLGLGLSPSADLQLQGNEGSPFLWEKVREVECSLWVQDFVAFPCARGAVLEHSVGWWRLDGCENQEELMSSPRL